MKLLDPGFIGKLKLKNRVVMAAMGAHGLHEGEGMWGKRYRAYYGARAAGGVGLITTEATFVTQALEPFSKGLFNPASDKHLDSMRLLANTLHFYGCKLSIQLTAGFGRVVPPPVVPEGVLPVSASVNTHFSPVMPLGPDALTRAITTEEAAALAQSFGFAAMRCREGGADCVELHGHEGYLLDQFMTPLWNRRDDHYGGSRDKRLNLAREAVAAIKREAGDDFPVIYRFGITHHLEGGRDEEEGLWVARELEKMGVDALHVDAGCYETHWWPHPPQYFPPGCMADIAAKVKQVTSLPVIAVGRLHHPETAERILAEGKADFIAIGRGLLSEPDWVNKIAERKNDELIPCLGCHEGCKWQMIAGEPTSCAINPSCGHEIDRALAPLKEKRSLLVVGGGPAGIEAARVGAARGFDVTLWEASERLGGNLWPASKPEFKYDLLDYLRYLERLAHRLPINCVFNKKATADDVRHCGADYVVLATGATMETPPFDNGASDMVFSVMQVLNGVEPPGNQVLVMGGGVIGCETALHLARRGKQVTISTRRDESALAEDLYDHNNHDVLLMMLQAADITVLANTIPVKMESDGAIINRNGAETKIPVDSLVFAGRMIPENGLRQSLADMRNVYAVGDCVAPERIMEAVWSAFKTVREIEP